MKPSIEYLELFAVTVGVLNWVKLFHNRKIVLFCDNEAVVHMINNNTSSCKNCMVLIRLIVFEELKYNVRVFPRYVSSIDNAKSDALSRLQWQRFKKLSDGTMNEKATPIPLVLWPMKRIWYS